MRNIIPHHSKKFEPISTVRSPSATHVLQKVLNLAEFANSTRESGFGTNFVDLKDRRRATPPCRLRPPRRLLSIKRRATAALDARGLRRATAAVNARGLRRATAALDTRGLALRHRQRRLRLPTTLTMSRPLRRLLHVDYASNAAFIPSTTPRRLRLRRHVDYAYDAASAPSYR